MSAYARTWWAKRAQILDVEIEPFLSQLVDHMGVVRQSQPKSNQEKNEEEAFRLALPPRPYKQLDFYEASDAPIFFGREKEIQTLSGLVSATPITSMPDAGSSDL